jgi:hypothetical protein
MFAGCLALLAGCICWLPEMADLVVSYGWLSWLYSLEIMDLLTCYSLYVGTFSWLHFLRGCSVYAHWLGWIYWLVMLD